MAPSSPTTQSRRGKLARRAAVGILLVGVVAVVVALTGSPKPPSLPSLTDLAASSSLQPLYPPSHYRFRANDHQDSDEPDAAVDDDPTDADDDDEGGDDDDDAVDNDADEDNAPSTNLPAPSNDKLRRRIPVVYVFFAGKLPESHYLWSSMRISSRFAPIVLLLGQSVSVPPTISIMRSVTIVRTNKLVSPEMRALRDHYIPLGYREPYARETMERYFALLAWMQAANVDLVFNADGDVAVVRDLGIDNGKWERLGCDSHLDLGLNGTHMTFEAHQWAVSGHSSVLRRDVLKGFCDFTLQVYKAPPSNVTNTVASRVREFLVEHRTGEHGFVSDMTLWWWFIALTSKWGDEWGAVPALRKLKVVDLPSLKQRRKWTFCDGQDLGFDHKRGFRRDWSHLKTLHFQGQTKHELFKFEKEWGAASG